MLLRLATEAVPVDGEVTQRQKAAGLTDGDIRRGGSVCGTVVQTAVVISCQCGRQLHTVFIDMVHLGPERQPEIVNWRIKSPRCCADVMTSHALMCRQSMLFGIIYTFVGADRTMRWNWRRQ